MFSVAADGGGGAGEKVKVWKWTGSNSFFQLCDPDRSLVAMGGGGSGEGSFGICVEDDFSRGTTGPCGTFGNDRGLAEEGGTFEIVNFEVYSFVGEL